MRAISALIVIGLISSLTISDARPYLGEFDEREDYSSDLSELSRRAAPPSGSLFPAFPGDEEYPDDDGNEPSTTQNYVIPPLDVTTEEAAEIPSKESSVPWYEKTGNWLHKSFKKIKEKVPDTAEAGSWFKRQFKKVDGYLRGNDAQK